MIYHTWKVPIFCPNASLSWAYLNAMSQAAWEILQWVLIEKYENVHLGCAFVRTLHVLADFSNCKYLFLMLSYKVVLHGK